MAYGNGGSVNQAMQAGQVRGYDIPTPDVPPRSVGMVGKHAAELHQILAEVFGRVETLEHVLSPVLTPEPPSVAGTATGGPTPMAARSSVAESLALAGEMGVQLIHRLERLTGRVEL